MWRKNHNVAIINSEDTIMAYDQKNIFAKILRGQIPCETVYEDDYVLAFEDINPQAVSYTHLRSPRDKRLSRKKSYA